MPDSKHTPRPWNVSDDGDMVEARESAPICTLFKADDFPCWDGPAGQLEAECEANARLIAAAPEMYVLVKDLADGAAADSFIRGGLESQARHLMHRLHGEQRAEGGAG